MTKKCAQGHPGNHWQPHLNGFGLLWASAYSGDNSHLRKQARRHCGKASRPHLQLVQTEKVTLTFMAGETEAQEMKWKTSAGRAWKRP